MAFREILMIEVKEVLRRWLAGQAQRKIARDTGIDRKTVGRYIAWAKQVELTPDDELSDGVVREVMQCVQARAEPERSDAWKC